jgi:glycosyltransferase involved in cell wall biosynthesis
MITVGFSTRKHNPNFIEHLRKSSGYKKIEIIEVINNGEKSLSKTYNEILNKSTNEIVVLCHDDIIFETSSWLHKLIKHFDKTEYGIIGVAGSTKLPKSGKWWEDRKKMVGIVNHQHNGKQWTSRYSDDIKNNIEEVVIVDGLFIAVNKKRIKNQFDETTPGFHFYDLNFCLPNFLNKVKIGVITNIRITHKSIGQTNQEWENNRKIFEENFKEVLPIKVKYTEEKKLKILICCLSFKTFTGSEIYVYELAKNLKKLNCSVTILSQIGGPLTDMAIKDNIKVLSFDHAPGFKLGDGKWGFNNHDGFVVSIPNQLYKISDVDYDVIHIQHKPIAEKIIQMYPEVDKVYTIHSEVIPIEYPIKDKSILKYIAIRPEIKDFLINEFNINEKDIKIIYNPIDSNKFNLAINNNGDYVLFVGTIDYLREKTIFDLVEYSKSINKKLLLIGENKSNYLETLLLNDHVSHIQSTWNVEKYVKNSFETAGIQLGRTTIEGWMCGKSSWIYKVDLSGNILSKEKFEPPLDIEKYYSLNVAKEIKQTYLEIL